MQRTGSEIWLEITLLCELVAFPWPLNLVLLVDESKNTFNCGRGFDALGSVLRAKIRKWQTFCSELEQHT